MSAEDEGDAGRVLRTWGEAGADVRAFVAASEVGEFLNGGIDRVRDERESVGVVVATGAERVGEIGEGRRAAVGVGAGFEGGAEPPGHAAKGGFGPGGDDERPGAVGR